jgi:hypothetical protein
MVFRLPTPSVLVLTVDGGHLRGCRRRVDAAGDMCVFHLSRDMTPKVRYSRLQKGLRFRIFGPALFF